MFASGLALSLGVSTQGANYYVDVKSAKGGDGSAKTPFATIQAAAEVAQAGDTVFIKPGTYCETVKPKNSGKEGSPIVFRNCPGEEKPLICAGDRVTGPWKDEGGGIYSAACPWDMGALRNHDGGTNRVTYPGNLVVVDGDMMIEAREPNITGKEQLVEIVRLGRMFDCDVKRGEVVINKAPAWGPDFWKGGVVAGIVMWGSQNGPISASSPASNGAYRVQVNTNKASIWWAQDGYGLGGNRCFLTGVRGALDNEKEYYLDEAAGRLYLMASGKADPSRMTVYAKKRIVALDMSGRSHVVFDSVSTMMGCVYLNQATNCAIRNGRHLYSSHFLHYAWYNDLQGKVGDPAAAAVYVSGESNRVEGCEIAYAATGLRLDGRDHVVRNCTITDIYAGSYLSGIFIDANQPVAGECGGHLIERNTIGRVSRSVIVWTTCSYPNLQMYKKCRVLHNHLFDYMKLTTDGGAIYSWVTDGGGTEIAYNWIHGDGDVDYAAIYFDDKDQNFSAHHNVLWDVKCGFLCKAGPHDVYNNTVWVRNTAWDRSAAMCGGSRGNVCNNLANRPPFLGGDLRNNLITREQKLFVGDPNHPTSGLDFRLQAVSAAIDAGVAVSNITDGTVGAPDVGAYEYGGADDVSAWTAGAWSEPTQPAQPGTFTAMADYRQISLAWSDSATNETAYVLERSADGAAWTLLATLPANSVSYTDAGFHLQTGTRYHYRLAARNGAGLSDWATVAAATLPVVRAPAISSPLTATGGVGFAFSYTIMASNGPERFAAAGLPKWFSLNPTNGVISGRPEVAGAVNVLLTAMNAKGKDTRTLALTLTPNDSFAAATGGTMTNYTENGVRYTAHIFTTNGSFRAAANWCGEVEYLLVAGGGAGGGGYNGAGGGAGGVRLGRAAVTPGDSWAITVGAGGIGNGGAGSNGMASAIVGDNVNVSATGGGCGGGDGWEGGYGGSGGGGLKGHEGQYYAGGGELGHCGGNSAGDGYMGGGGGAGTAGASAQNNSRPGIGGAGTHLTFSGVAVEYARGGAGGARALNADGVDAPANMGYGGSGGGKGDGSAKGGSGGSGIVILRYVTGGK